MVGETTCDGKKKAFEILAEHVPVHVMETPHMKREKDRLLWRSEGADFARQVEEFTGNKIDSAGLERGIKEVRTAAWLTSR